MMFHDNEKYQPPYLTVNKNVLKKEYSNKEKIHAEFTYQKNEAKSLPVTGAAKIFQVGAKVPLKSETFKNAENNGDIKVDLDPVPPGDYVLVLSAEYGSEYDQSNEYRHYFTVPANKKPIVEMVDQGYEYYIPNTDVTFKAKITDQDKDDTKFTTQVFFDGKVVQEINDLQNSEDVKTFSFKIPPRTKAYTYDVKLVVSDGKDSTEHEFKIKFKSNSKLSVSYELKEELTAYNPGDKVELTAVVVDPDVNFDSKFTISVLYGDTQKLKEEKKNENGIIRVPITIEIPADEKSTAVDVKIKVQSQNELDWIGLTLNINQPQPNQEGGDGSGGADKAEGKDTKVDNKNNNKALIAVLVVLIVCCVAVVAFIFYILIKMK
ncbi:hypothetical protein TVAG_340710 [Trichomonas vaginalis G3]|uniref:Uncharacterized protein n=1 Tax=Trichomonas vaginalis (strain ATCC PRA-98 / G3) TaxID=412133 RepID=A2DTN0_TRIV3|nr:hypothetical protein TVAGG3_1037880 [Trichomonas vaginalis G3]EAY16177.1 hypothetical protein TVAG_340710 [Trichomonas vaginalis G3]KAI5493332.1 hypothetical protein TVAGG3_1037880 [Trichomonas vaginalis G3]|eukprot:XP_001328400.1 hypothetical protein [Trichomonas vaginalis G3]